MFRFCARDKILLFVVCTFHLIGFGMVFALDFGAFIRSKTFDIQSNLYRFAAYWSLPRLIDIRKNVFVLPLVCTK